MDDAPTSANHAGTREQLTQRKLQLEDARPGIVVPIAMMVVGTLTFAVDLLALAFGGDRPPDPGRDIAMLSVLAVGVGLILGGAIYLITQLVGRRANTSQRLEVEEALENRGPTPAPGNPGPPAARPLAPGQPPARVNAAMPLLVLTLARF